MRAFLGIGLPPASGGRRIGDRSGAGPPRPRRVDGAEEPAHHPEFPWRNSAGACAARRAGDAGRGLGNRSVLPDGGRRGAFPGTRNPRVLWVGFLEPLELVRQLQQNMENALSRAGFPRENRPFHPHITVGRSRGALPPAWGSGLSWRFPGRTSASFPCRPSRCTKAGWDRGGRSIHRERFPPRSPGKR